MSKIEIALSPSSLTVTGNVDIHERASTSGADGIGVGGNVIPAGAQRLSNHSIQTDQPFFVHFNWTTTGSFARFLGGGQWRCNVYFEKMGSGETAASLDLTGMEASVGVSGTTYNKNLQVAAGAIPVGIYRVVAALQWMDASNKPGPISYFDEVGMIRIYADQ